MPEMKMPEMKMPEIKIDEITADITKVAKDVVYVGVGLGILTFQKAQVQRQELQKRLGVNLDNRKADWDKVGDRFETQVKTLEARLDDLETKVAEALDQLQEKLPEQAAEILGQARGAVKSARSQVMDLVKRDEKAA